jgi:glycosyltransferase involved in cell wall biosynthesis
VSKPLELLALSFREKIMKIVIDCRFWGSTHTGLGRYAQSLVTALHQLRPEEEVYLLIAPADKKRIKRLVPRFKLISCSARPYSLQEQWQILRLLKQLKPDLVHFLHFNIPFFYPHAFVVTIHDLIKHHSTGLSTTTKGPLGYFCRRLGYHLVMRQAINKSEFIFTPSQWVKQDILHFYSVPKTKIVVTPEAPASVYLKKPVVKSSKFSLKSPYLIYIGNAYPHKNILQLIKAVQKVNQQHRLQLIIITARNVFYQRLRQQIRQLKAQSVVKLKGFTPDKDLRYLYQHSAAFITPSLLEGFGLPGLEAMAAGTVVLSSNRTSLPEVYGKAAIYFNPDDIDDMAEKILFVLDLNQSQRQSLIAKAKQHVQQYSWENTARKTLDVYHKVLPLA